MEPVELHQGIRCTLKNLRQRVDRVEASFKEYRREDTEFKRRILELLEGLGLGLPLEKKSSSSVGDEPLPPARDVSSLKLESLFQIPSVTSEQISSSFSSLPSRRGSGIPDDHLVRLQHIAFTHTTFDTNSDGFISYPEASSMQEVTEGTPLPEEDWHSLCKHLNVNPTLGFDRSDFIRMYTDPKLETNLTKDYDVAMKIAGDSFAGRVEMLPSSG